MPLAVTRPALLLGALALAAGAAGCGTAGNKDSATSFSGAQRQVAQVVEDLQSNATDESDLCSKVLSASFVRAIERHGKDSCATSLHKSLRDTDIGTRELQVKSVSITGATATAKVVTEVSNDPDRPQTFSFVREGRPAVWKISGVGA